MWIDWALQSNLTPDIIAVVFIATLLDKVVIPDTFNELFIVDASFNVVDSETFKVDMNVEGLLKLTNAGGLI